MFITGSSGCGKSSFAQAGLLPELERHYAQYGVQARQAVFHPSTDPLLMLEDALARLGMAPPPSEDAPRRSPAGFRARLSDSAPAGRASLLVVDQFEECFTQAAPPERGQFFAVLEELLRSPLPRVHFLVTLRSDFLKDLFEYPALYQAGKDGLELRVMGAGELRDAILAPLQAQGGPVQAYAGKTFEPALLDALVEDASQQAAYLPLLQVTLQELWRNGSLTRAAYRGLASAIRRRADAVLDFSDYSAAAPRQPRPESDRAEITRLLLDLVGVSTLEDAHPPVRRQRWKAELERGSPARARLLAELVDARLVSVALEPRGGAQGEAVGLIHESLLENWPYLKEAIHLQREALRRQARFETSLREWQAAQAEERAGYLLSGARLDDARRLLADHAVALEGREAREFLRLSLERAEDEIRRRLRLERQARRRLQALAALLGVLLLASLAWIAAPYALSLAARGELASIPPGQALLGPDPGYASPRGDTPQTIALGGFQIERYEVTNRQYRLCVLAGKCSPPALPFDLADPARREHPVTGVTATQAMEYCRWVGRRLPDEVEWERAARGPQGWLWPWGDTDPTPAQANLFYGFSENGEGPALAPTGGRPAGCSPAPEGVCDLIGNAAEWTASWQPDDSAYHPGERWDGAVDAQSFARFIIVRGFDYQSAWIPQHPQASLATTSQIFPGFQSAETIGFRCARPSP